MAKGENEGQYLIFLKYTREYLSQVTGYSKGSLCKIATGKQAPSEQFIGTCCHRLQEPQSDLFKLIEPQGALMPPVQPRQPNQDLLDTIDELAHRLTDAEAAITALQDELKQYS